MQWLGSALEAAKELGPWPIFAFILLAILIWAGRALMESWAASFKRVDHHSNTQQHRIGWLEQKLLDTEARCRQKEADIRQLSEEVARKKARIQQLETLLTTERNRRE